MSESGASAKRRPDGERILPENDSAAELLLSSSGRLPTFPNDDAEGFTRDQAMPNMSLSPSQP